jgi:hypothetical protein
VKKEAKTFANASHGKASQETRMLTETDNSFLVLSFKKELLSCLEPEPLSEDRLFAA